MIRISFSEDKPFSERAIRFTLGVTGLYFIFLKSLKIPYPFGASRLIYIGMSESAQNSIGKRLRSHLTGQSGNRAIRNYASCHEVLFTHYPFDLLKNVGTTKLSVIESMFLEDFLGVHGAFPICNNQSGVQIVSLPQVAENLNVDWNFFG